MALSLVQLISNRIRELGITRGELARRMGYANVAKGCRRLDQICARDVKMAENLRIQLAQGLEVDAGVIDESIEFTRSKQISAEDKAYRESFKPHAVILTEYKIPTQITFYAMTGGSRHRMIPMKEGSSPETFATQSRDAPAGHGSLSGCFNRVRGQLHSRFRLRVQQGGQIDRKARPRVSRGAIKRRCQGQGSR